MYCLKKMFKRKKRMKMDPKIKIMFKIIIYFQEMELIFQNLILGNNHKVQFAL